MLQLQCCYLLSPPKLRQIKSPFVPSLYLYIQVDVYVK